VEAGQLGAAAADGSSSSSCSSGPRKARRAHSVQEAGDAGQPQLGEDAAALARPRAAKPCARGRAAPAKASGKALRRGPAVLPECGACCPGLGRWEQLQDEHLTFAVRQLLVPPKHVWVATPAQVVLLLCEQDGTDKHADRDGALRSLWDSSHVSVLVLPITSDLQAGWCRADAGGHWSVLVARRTEGGPVAAQLLDSLAAAPPGAMRTARQVLGCLSRSKHWRAAPRRPQLRSLRLQDDAYQCGCFCILLMQQVVAGERGEDFKVTAERARCLRSKLCAGVWPGSAAAGA